MSIFLQSIAKMCLKIAVRNFVIVFKANVSQDWDEHKIAWIVEDQPSYFWTYQVCWCVDWISIAPGDPSVVDPKFFFFRIRIWLFRKFRIRFRIWSCKWFWIRPDLAPDPQHWVTPTHLAHCVWSSLCKLRQTAVLGSYSIKGTVAWDFWSLIFFINL